LREPLVGSEAVLPVGEEVRHWFASPRSATRFILRAAERRGFQQAGEQPGFQLLMLCYQQVLNHRHFAEQTYVLEGTHHAHAGNLLTR